MTGVFLSPTLATALFAIASTVSAAPNLLPVTFEPNQGQFDGPIRFAAHGSYDAAFLPGEVLLNLHGNGKTAAVGLAFEDAQPSAHIDGIDRLAGTSSYFIGQDSRNWHTGIPLFGKIRYRQLYPGVDAVFYGQGERLEFDLECAPGIDVRSIRLRIEGASPVQRGGDLVIGTAAGRLRIARPVVYQMRAGRRAPVNGRFRIRGKSVSFDIGPYDRRKPLVIDPVLAYSTYLTDEEDWAIATDAAGNLYVAGDPTLASLGTFVTTPGAVDTKVGGVAVTKLDPTGMVVYRARLGGVASSGPSGIAADAQGDAYIAGIAGNDYPTTPNAFEPNFFFTATPSQLETGFATEINPTGTALLYSTFITIKGAVGYCNGITEDSAHNMYVVGEGYAPASADLSANTGGGGYVLKLNPQASGAASFVWGVGFGAYHDSANKVAVDSGGNAYVIGNIPSGTLAVTPNALQASPAGANPYLAKVNPQGQIAYATYLGGSGLGALGTDVAVDAAGVTYVLVSAGSQTFPLTPNAFQTTSSASFWIGKINTQASGAAGLLYGSYFGTDIFRGITSGGIGGIAVDNAGDVVLAGTTYATTLPLTSDAFQKTSSAGAMCGVFPCYDAFLSKLSTTASGSAALLYSTYIGGTNVNRGNAVALDSNGNMYVAGYTQSADFPVMNAYQPALNVQGTCTLCQGNGFALKIGTIAQNPQPAVTALSPGSVAPGTTSGFTLTVTGSGFVAGSKVEWNGTPLPTAAVSDTSLTATVAAAQVPSSAAAQVTVVNPAPGGGTSAPAAFTVGPAVAAGGIVNAASFAGGAGLSPGTIVTAFGSALAPANGAGVSVLVNGTPAPVFAAFPGQINFELPWELQGQAQASVQVSAFGMTSPPATLKVTPFSPGIFGLNAAGQGAVTEASSGVVAAAAGSIQGLTTEPVSRGAYITIYCTGLGPVTNQPATGTPAAASPLAMTTTQPTVTIGGIAISGDRILFSGLAPGFDGLYQVNVQVPANAPTGAAVPLSIAIAGVQSNVVTVAIQ